MDITKGREPPAKKQISPDDGVNKTKVSATVAPFSMSSSARHKALPLPAAGHSVAVDSFPAGAAGGVEVSQDITESFGKAAAEGFTANLKFCTNNCRTCLTEASGPMTHALVVRVTASGHATRLRIAGGKEVPDAYVIKTEHLHDEKYVLMGSSKGTKVSLMI